LAKLTRLLVPTLAASTMLVAAAFAAAAVTVEPLPGEPPVRTFSMAEYNSNVQNWGAALGPDGLMYIGGGMGLLEYDGVRWTRHDTPNNSRVRVLHIQELDAAPARFWIGSTNEFGYFQRDATGAMAYHSISEQLPENQREFGDIRGIVEVDGALYFHSIPTLFRWDGEQLRQLAQWDGIFRLMLAVDERVYIAVRDRLHEVTDFDNPEPPTIERWRWDSLSEDPIAVTFLEPWPDGRMLLGTYADGLYWLGDGAPERFALDVDVSDTWPYIVHRRDDGTILLATRNAGLFHLTGSGRLIEHVSSNNGLPKDVINGLAEDGQGGVWLPQDGVITRVALDAPMRTWGAESGIESAAGLTRHAGHALIAGMGAGVLRLEAAASDRGRARSLDASALDFPLTSTWDLRSIEDQLLWAGYRGVRRLDLDPDGTRIVGQERLLNDHYAYRLTPSRLRAVVYAELESGLGLLTRNDEGRWVAAGGDSEDGKVAGIDVRPHHVAEAADGRVWVGTVLGRLFVLEWRDSELVLVAELGADEGVPQGYAWPFVLGQRLVLGTFDGGYRPRLDADGDVVGVEPDPDFDNETLGEPRGIYKMASPDGMRVLAGVGDGGALRFGRIDQRGVFTWQPHPVPGIEIGQNDFIHADDDAAWIGRAPGLVRLTWPEVEPAGQAPQLVVTRAGYPDASEGPQWLRGGPGAAAALAEAALPFRKDSLRFEYALAKFDQPQANRYRVRLDGLDRDWSQWSAETRRDYTNLPGGDYVFRVQARDGQGRLSESAPLLFSIAPPWFLGTPMLLVYAAAVLLLLWLTARYGQQRREEQLLARQNELELQVAERTRKIRRQAREIREMSDARAAFFANVSHELRTPLTLTRAPLEELARDTIQFTPTQRQHLDMALRNTAAMQSLIGQVLDLHRLDAGGMPFHPLRADLCVAVTAIVERFKVHAKCNGVGLIVEGAEAPMLATFDAEHLATIVSNLVSNAVKVAPEGSLVTVRLAAQHDGHIVEVLDTGPGVAGADRERIFERYQQAADAPHGGTGIGLALVRELVELHQGRVEVGDNPGGGACFRIWLPPRPDLPTTGEQPVTDWPEQPAAGYPDAEEAENGAGDRPTVLIVDDNAELRGFLRLRLGRAYHIVEAGDGKQGLLKARETLPDAIVTDGMMPELDGLSMTSRLKSDPETDYIPVLMLTARGGPDAVIRGMQAGADDYLAKPFDTAELAARIAGLIASRRRLRDRLARQTVQPEPSEDPFVTRARSVASEHLGEPGFSVRDWAALLHMDRTTLFRKFKAAVDRSPEEELREMRLQCAAKLLRAQAGNVAEVADAVGFASVSAFSRRFRERFGETPARHRNDLHSDST